MTKVKCEHCGGEFGVNDTMRISGVIMCHDCAERSFADGRKIPRDEIESPVDPTVCSNCRADNLNTPLPTVASMPVCEACESFFRNRPFPGWVMAGLVGVVALVVFSLFWNARFMRGYYEMKVATTALAQGEIERATELMFSASQRVPESEDLRVIASFYKGFVLLGQNKSAEALELLQSCRGMVPDDFHLEDLIARAQIGVAFDNADYDEFLKLAIRMSAENRDDPTYSGQVASAYACKYAVTGSEEYKIKSLAALDLARDVSQEYPASKEYFTEYEDRILHRLASRKIIDREAFKEKFPDGWKQGKE